MTIEVDFPSRPDDNHNPHSALHSRSSSGTSATVTPTSTSSSILTLSSIAAVCRQRADQYETAVINDVLHLSYQGYTAIQTAVFASFSTLSTLYLDHNKLTSASLAALSSAPLLHALLLHSNHITSLTALPPLHRLRTLNVSENALTDLHGVEQLTALVTLDATHNAIATIEPVHTLHRLRDLLLAHNCITASPSPVPTLTALPTLRVLHLHHNPLVTQQPTYRRTLLSQLPSVQWLDERGVREDERAGLEGWKESGMQGEREARGRLLEERREKEERQWQQWKDSRAAHRAVQEKRVSYSSLKHAIEDEQADPIDGQSVKAALDTAVALESSDDQLGDSRHPATTVSVTEQAAASEELSDFHVMRSLSIEQYYHSIQQSVPSTLHLMSDSDDDDEQEDADDSTSAVPFLLGITPALSALPMAAERPKLSSTTASPPTSSSPSSSLSLSLSSSPTVHSREPSELMSAFVLSQRGSNEEKEQPVDLPPDCRVQVGRVLAMLSEEAAHSESESTIREANVSEEDSEVEEEVQWVSYGVESSSDEEEAGHRSRRGAVRR